jgi:ABC-type transport system involved in multi-copper enzyme maturation permease subunit
MAAVTAGRARRDAAPARARRAGLAGTVRSELVKIRSVRSTYWALFLLVVASVAWSVAFCAGEAAHWAQTAPADRAGFDPAQASVLGLASLGQLIIVVLGALTITSEYSTGMMRTSLTVMPRRGVLYAAKGAVFVAVSLAVAIPASFICFFTGQRLLASTHVAAALSQPNVLRAVLAAGLYVALCGLFAFGLGAIVRSTPGGITAAYGFLFLLPQLAKALPSTWYADLVRWLPGGDVINALTSTSPQISEHLFSAWGEFAVFGGYTAVVLAAGAVLFRRRDA